MVLTMERRELMSSRVSLAERLQVLFRVWHPANESEETSTDAAAAISAAGHQVSAEQIDALRSGAQTEADPDLLTAIAVHFRTPAKYLLDDDIQDLHEQLLLLEQFRMRKVQSIQLRGERTDADRRALLRVLGEGSDSPSAAS
ncbi:hypothetical protein AS032_35295 [Rhodococcus qingshengii]|jgi:hypothetical protein|nr:hypothetical protein ABM90_03640 [Rhodococcus erythropolis]KSU55109.1 hypothetical protein AS032_35295 [Rhodococcus qingshengii]KZF17780.1 hypothetical protein A2J01_22725 [Rhodococcus sp. EPR-134]